MGKMLATRFAKAMVPFLCFYISDMKHYAE